MAAATASIVNVYKQVMDITRSGTSGQDSQDEFNRRAVSVQNSLVEMLVDVNEENTKVTDALKWLKKTTGDLISDSTGLITLPDDYLHLEAVTYVNSSGNQFPTSKIGGNSIDMTRTSPIRKANLTKNKVNYYFNSMGMYVQPEQAGVKVRVKYIKQVPAAAITLTPVEDSTGDYVTPTVGTEFGWPLQVQNLLMYMMLEQYGVEIKEQLMVQYAQYGIGKEMIRQNTTDKSMEENIRWGNRN